MKQENPCIECLYRKPHDEIVGSISGKALLYFVLNGKQYRCKKECKE